MSMLNFLRNNKIVKSKEDAIALLNSSSVMDIAGDGTLIEARYSDEDKIKTIFALYHISGDNKTATIYDSEAHIEPDTKINEKITNITERLDKIDGGSGGTTTPVGQSIIDSVANLIESVGDKTGLVTTDKTNLVNAINETFKKIGTIPVLVEAQLRLDGDYNIDKTTGKITDNTSFTPSENNKEGLVITFLSKDSNDRAQVKSVFIDFEKIFIESEVGNGLKVAENHKINVNIDQDSEKYLSVSSNGLKFTGLDAEIKNRKDTDTELNVKITTEINERKKADTTLSGRITNEIKTLKETLENEIKTVTGNIDLSDYVKTETLKNYQTTSAADSKYATKTDLGNKADKTALANYQPKGDYATKTDLGNKADKTALANYLTTKDAASTYQPKGEYVAKTELGGYVKTETLKNYQTTSAADSKYATKTELDKKADSTELANYQPKGDYATNATLASKQKELEVKIKASQVVAGDGININNQTVGIKIHPKNEGRFFSVETDGLKFSGLLEMEEVIAASLNDLNTRIKKLEEKIARL